MTISTHTVGAGADLITYDVRGDLATGTPLVAFGSPMDAGGFVTLAGLVTDRPFVTYDPRGAGRNPVGSGPLTPDDHAGDLARVIEALGVGPVDCFGTSGGAVNLLRLAETRPELVRAVVAHEPPTVALLPDRGPALAALADITTTYAAAGHGPAMARFVALVMHSGEVSDDYLRRPAPDPARFAMSAEDDGSRTDPLMRNMPAGNRYEPDVAALRRLGERLTIAVGVGSGEELAARGARSVAAAIGMPVTDFPSHHAGFLGGEHGQSGEPEAFAARLREVLGRRVSPRPAAGAARTRPGR